MDLPAADRGIRAWIASAASIRIADRLIAMVERLVYSAASLASFAAGSIGVFLAFAWPQLLHPIIIGYLVAVLIFRASRLLFEFILSPPEYTGFGDPTRYRVLPVSDDSASFWVKRISYAIGWYAFGWTTVSLMGILGFSIPIRLLVAYALGIVLLAMGIEAVWHRPGQVEGRSVGPFEGKARRERQELADHHLLHLLWLLWVASVRGASSGFSWCWSDCPSRSARSGAPSIMSCARRGVSREARKYRACLPRSSSAACAPSWSSPRCFPGPQARHRFHRHHRPGHGSDAYHARRVQRDRHTARG